MNSFFSGLVRGLFINIFGIIVVYVIIFCLMAPKLPRDAKGLKGFIGDMVNVKGTVLKMQNKSADYLEKPGVKAALEGDSVPTEELAKVAAGSDDIDLIKKDLQRLQKQLDRIENQNRAISLRLSQQEKIQQQAAPAEMHQ